MTEKQLLSSSYDKDTGILDMHLFTGEHYYVTNPLHAKAIRAKVSPGGRLNVEQLTWLERYRVIPIGTDRKKLAEKIKGLRAELMP